MKYVGLHSVISRNNARSVLLLLTFPAIILGMIWVFLAIVSYFSSGGDTPMRLDVSSVNASFFEILPWAVAIVTIWYIIAYFINTSLIRRAVGARPLERKENPRVYNIVENLSMACGMNMPQINVVDDPQLNAFASGIDEKSYTVTVTTGIIQKLNDDELAGVIAHELTHIRNRDTRLLITSIIFVGIVSTVMSVIVRMLFYGSPRSRGKKGGNILVLLVALVCAALAYLFVLLTRFAISRKREFMADAGGAELCGNPWALASALRKISADPGLKDVGRDDIAQMYIVYPSSFKNFVGKLFSTHPDIAERIRLLEQY